MTTALDRLTSVAAAIVDAPMAAIVRVQPGKVDILASYQVSAVTYAAHIDVRAAGFELNKPGIVCNTDLHPYFATHPLVKGPPFLKALIQVPVPVPGQITLVIGYNEAISLPSKKKISDLVHLARIAASEYEINQEHDQRFDDQHIPLSLIISKYDTLSQPAALLDHNLCYIYLNEAMAALNKRKVEDHIGHNIRSMGIFSVDAMEAIFQTALRDGRSFDQVELISQRHEKQVRVYAISCKPLHPLGQPDAILGVIASDVSSLRAVETQIEYGLAESSPSQPFAPDPTVRFLTETLLRRQCLRQRKSISYLTLRSWRKPVRTYQIEALKALKTAPPHDLIDTAASEIIEALGRIVGVSAFAQIVPVPCSRSKDDVCLSRLIADEVSRRIGKPVAFLLASSPRKGSSHPKENATRPPMRLIQPAIGPCLVIDDVATSGAHLEEAITKLRPSAHSVFAIAWIGGDADHSA